MEDADLIEQFESCTLPNECFHHADHIKMAWLYLHRYGPIDALARFSQGLRRFAAAHGKANRYHETITWSYLFLIRERIERYGADQTWQQFADSNPDLFNWRESVLRLYYKDDTLNSDLARHTFLFPDNL